MSEVSLEAESRNTSAEDPQMDCEEEADKAEESLSEDVKQESVDNSREVEDRDEVLYDIDIDSASENAENSGEDVQEEDEGVKSESVVTHSDSDAAHVSDSVDDGRHETNHHVETAETPEESGDSHTETKVIFKFTLYNLLRANPYSALGHVADLIFIWWRSLSCVIEYGCDGLSDIINNMNLSHSSEVIVFVSGFYVGRCVSDFFLLCLRFQEYKAGVAVALC